MGSVTVGGRSSPLDLHLTNELGYAVTVVSLSIDDPAFPATSDQCSGTLLPAGGACDIQIVFAPQVRGEASTGLKARLQHDCTSKTYFPCDGDYADVGTRNFTITELGDGTRQIAWWARISGDDVNQLTGLGV